MDEGRHWPLTNKGSKTLNPTLQDLVQKYLGKKGYQSLTFPSSSKLKTEKSDESNVWAYVLENSAKRPSVQVSYVLKADINEWTNHYFRTKT